MSTGLSRNQIANNYAQLLSIAVPGFVGFYCYDRNGNKFCEHAPEQPVDSADEFTTALSQVMGEPEQGPLQGRVEVEGCVAFIYSFEVSLHSLLGAIAVVVTADEAESYTDMQSRICPVVNSLYRELNLSFRLMIAHKKLDVLSVEEHLLHEIEKLTHRHEASNDTLTEIVTLCGKLLHLQGVALMVPDKQIRILCGDTPKPAEIRLMLSEIVDAYEENPTEFPSASVESPEDLGGITMMKSTQFKNSELLSVPVLKDRHEPIGILVLTGWQNAGFSIHRRTRIGRYVAAHIEDVISRDYDSLTGLMNWGLFETRFMAECQQAKAAADGAERLALCFDIDRLHVINENLGPEKGDEMLAAFSDVLKEVLGNQVATRISSDTFAAIIRETDVEVGRTIAEEVRSRFAELEFTNGVKKERASVSAGVGPVGKDSKTASAALALAQVACKAAKDRGRGRVEVYALDDKSLIQRMDDIQLVGDIRSAIESGKLSLYAQPIVALNENSDLHYFEALVRLIDPSGQHVPPSEFFSSAERYQLMEELDRWVIDEALKQVAAHRHDLGSKRLRIAINLSGQSLGSEQFLPFVQEMIARHQVAPDSLCFEITETVAIANLQRAQNFMHVLKKLGCHFSLDDFGTGLSSFSYLKLFPISMLKIDGSFVTDITTNNVSQSVVAAISEVARVMELETVAECVADDQAISLLRDLGVTYGQGYMLGEPEQLATALDNLGTCSDAKITA